MPNSRHLTRHYSSLRAFGPSGPIGPIIALRAHRLASLAKPLASLAVCRAAEKRVRGQNAKAAAKRYGTGPPGPCPGLPGPVPPLRRH